MVPGGVPRPLPADGIVIAGVVRRPLRPPVRHHEGARRRSAEPPWFGAGGRRVVDLCDTMEGLGGVVRVVVPEAPRDAGVLRHEARGYFAERDAGAVGEIAVLPLEDAA